MIDVIVFHHAHGLTRGVEQFAERLSGAGHRVMVPDLYDGEHFDDLDDGVEHAQQIGFDTLIDRGAGVAAGTDDPFATVGFSLGVLPAQHLAQTHSRCRAAVLCHAAIPLGTFAEQWPDDVALQLHSCDRDRLGDHPESVALAAAVAGAEFFSYGSDVHLPADDSLPGYDPAIASAMMERTIDFLARVTP